jgi:formylglycine-generating enzyme required for sulfatase activity
MQGRARVAALALFAVGCGSSDDGTPERDASPADARTLEAGGDDALGTVDAGAAGDGGSDAPSDGCPQEMARIDSFCVDRYEAYVVEVDDGGVEHPHSPYRTVEGLAVRAKSAPGVTPQGYVSQVEASAACALAGKRLCDAQEFGLACRGPDAGAHYPYGGTTHVAGNCNEGKGSYVELLFGPDAAAWTYADFNDPRLNQIDGGLAATASYTSCRSPFGVFDCVGNLHEWGSDPPDSQGHGRFRGGYYGDAEINGPGCLYVTSAHDLTYHDYSTGFRCCMDARP